MADKRKLDREGLEIYLLNLLLAYRPMLFVCGIFLLFYAIGMITQSVILGMVALLPPIFLLLLCYSYHLTLQTAKFAAWLRTLWQRDA